MGGDAGGVLADLAGGTEGVAGLARGATGFLAAAGCVPGTAAVSVAGPSALSEDFSETSVGTFEGAVASLFEGALAGGCASTTPGGRGAGGAYAGVGRGPPASGGRNGPADSGGRSPLRAAGFSGSSDPAAGSAVFTESAAAGEAVVPLAISEAAALGSEPASAGAGAACSAGTFSGRERRGCAETSFASGLAAPWWPLVSSPG